MVDQGFQPAVHTADPGDDYVAVNKHLSAVAPVSPFGRPILIGLVAVVAQLL